MRNGHAPKACEPLPAKETRVGASQAGLRVAIDATALGSGRGGDETHLRALITGLHAAADGERDRFVLLLRPEVPVPSIDDRLFSVRRLPDVSAPARYLFAVPRTLGREVAPLQLLHTTTHAPLRSPIPVALLVHDLSFMRHPELFPLRARLRLNLLVPMHVRAARVILTVSEFCRRDLITAFALAPDRVMVVPNAVASPQPADRGSDAARLRALGVSQPYGLYLGNLHARKNVVRLIEAFARARARAPEMASHQLVIAGTHWWKGGAEERASRVLPDGPVTFVGRVSDEDRTALLRGAEWLGYPSIFEGFGLPPLEAMAVGTPVLASDRGAIPEVVGDAALLVDPFDVEAMTTGILQLSRDSGLRSTLRERGLLRVERYSFASMGARAMEAFHRAVRAPESAQ
jgi:glycosyltransferase involved in cell wall biosynthesis